MTAPPPSDNRIARDLRGFGPLGLTAIVIILVGNGSSCP